MSVQSRKNRGKRSVCMAALMVSGIAGLRIPSGAQENVPRIPPPGVMVSAGDRADLESGIAKLSQEIEGLRSQYKNKAGMLDLLPDIQIYYNAARYALTYDEFFNPGEIGGAKTLLQEGMERAQSLREGKAPWTTATGLVVRGYVSKIDNSVQPYGLVIPASYQAGSATKHRLDIWYHGRGETLSEVNFLRDREHNPGEFTPPDTFVLHPYGRFCNANRFAGEVDTFEALAHVRKHYPIDANRIAVRGFSMGGASCWQFATHFASDWDFAAPGAGFTETYYFLNLQNSKEKPRGMSRNCGTGTTVRITRLISQTARWWRTAAKRTGRNRPPT